MEKKTIGVFFGSRSCEHEVSIISAVQMMRYADPEKYNTVPVYITTSGEWYTGEKLKDMRSYTPFDPYCKDYRKVQLDMAAGSGALVCYHRGKGLLKGLEEEVVARLDCAVLVLHGLHGEDGSLQGLLEMANIPYTSSGVTASAVGMDKITMKCFFRGMGYPVLPSVPAVRSDYEKDADKVCGMIEKELGYPVFVKPACLGSSIGVSRAGDRENLKQALELAFSYDRRVLVEKGLNKPIEVNCSVLGYDDDVEASVLEMPIDSGDFLDFSEKYLSGGGAKGMASLKRVMPAPIGEELTKKLQELSKEIFRAMDCKGVVRIDYMLDRESDHYYITEINTIPGSLAFYLWQECGVKYSELIDRMVACAERAHDDKNRNNYAFTSDILKGVSLGGTKGAKGTKGCKL